MLEETECPLRLIRQSPAYQRAAAGDFVTELVAVTSLPLLLMVFNGIGITPVNIAGCISVFLFVALEVEALAPIEQTVGSNANRAKCEISPLPHQQTSRLGAFGTPSLRHRRCCRNTILVGTTKPKLKQVLPP